MNYLVQELIAECLWIIHCEQPANVVDAENVIDNILILQSEMLARVSHPDKRYAMKYFKKLRTDFPKLVRLVKKNRHTSLSER